MCERHVASLEEGNTFFSFSFFFLPPATLPIIDVGGEGRKAYI